MSPDIEIDHLAPLRALRPHRRKLVARSAHTVGRAVLQEVSFGTDGEALRAALRLWLDMLEENLDDVGSVMALLDRFAYPDTSHMDMASGGIVRPAEMRA